VATLTAGSPASAASGELFHRSTALADLEQRMAKARAAGQPVIVDFYASWCTDCVRMEKTTFRNPQVQAALAGYVLLQADVTANDAASNAIKKKFGVFGPPAVLFFGPDGRERKELNFYGYRDVSEFLALVGRV
jgi:thiol:disulfide interchange protein DsbD